MKTQNLPSCSQHKVAQLTRKGFTFRISVFSLTVSFEIGDPVESGEQAGEH